MPTWSEYREIARSRGALALELFIVESTLVKTPAEAQKVLPQHLNYQREMEAAGKLMLAGPLSDTSGEDLSGGGLIIYRAASMDEARNLALDDPMHEMEIRTFTIRRWLVNEGSISLSIKLSEQKVSLT